MVNGVASWEKLANGGAPFNMSTELANGVAPLANGENGGRRGTSVITNQVESAWSSSLTSYISVSRVFPLLIIIVDHRVLSQYYLLQCLINCPIMSDITSARS
jgi:hypothetical protein